ncbi:MAG: FtsW/RodA/SpoVE family cell cycle protein [Bacillota bacterium]|nr:FtsW/RodA/SpoVE family cell cycle protein [Bacillota bacterium]
MKKSISGISDYFLNTDKFLWLLTIATTVYSLLLIKSMQRAGDYNYVRTQLIAIVIGYICAVIISVIDYEYIINAWWILAAIGLIMTFLVFFMGIKVQGTVMNQAWIRLPGGYTVQPSEYTKIIFIITLSKHLSYLNSKGKLKTFLGFMTLALHALVPTVLIHLQGDDGTAIVFFGMFLIMLFMAGIQWRYFAVFAVLLGAGLPLLWTHLLNNDQKNRIMSLFDLDGNALTTYGWQQYQSKVSIASGGLQGYGLFHGPRVAQAIVPEQENDFIFTVSGEELGFIGCMFLLLILLAIMFKLMYNASKARDDTGKYICFGVFSIIFLQTTINIGMVLGLLPVIGLTLPFFSSGGTSCISLFLAMGLVQSVYMHRNNSENVKVKMNIDRRI